MAEFKEVVKNARRLCRSRALCSECPLSAADKVCYFYIAGDPYKKVNLERIESIVIQWAKNHPENDKEEKHE